MISTTIGYILGQYYTKHNEYVSFEELVSGGYPVDGLKDAHLNLLLDVNQIVQKKDTDWALQVSQLLSRQNFRPVILPFYLLPCAYLPASSMREVLDGVVVILKQLTPQHAAVRNVLALVSAIKWGMTTKSCVYSYLHRTFPSLMNNSNIMGNILLDAMMVEPESGNMPAVEKAIREACKRPKHAAFRAALAAAMAEANGRDDYKPEAAGEYSYRFPLSHDYTCTWDNAVVSGYRRIDGYISWEMKAKNPLLSGINLMGSEDGPDRNYLCFWHWLHQHLTLQSIYDAIDNTIAEDLIDYMPSDWKSWVEKIEVNWSQQEVLVVMRNRCIVKLFPQLKGARFIADPVSLKKAFPSPTFFWNIKDNRTAVKACNE